ncbi:bifunctional UDP-N-acetylglucosamine diphosphorylase/glucosamine-1-phosphate N-acetyltransferase GlmU [Fodinicurvata sp. EGI_FJ10296]|uniref:bifunctional UDP-N-acetylglucosamine diphosphorylase/glucosamine-1-phosphate N-acetyltransferase GlmU n=1 Tax=Fodinicurvata sp. EGI_FJ10296 TaxID=3231908 RepID=UPI003452BD3F
MAASTRQDEMGQDESGKGEAIPDTGLACIVLAAGKGTRMKSRLPKVMHPLAGIPMIGHVLASLSALGAVRSAVVVGPGMQALANSCAPTPVRIQEERNGTAGAVLAAADIIENFSGDVLVVYGDTPLVRPETLRAMVHSRRETGAAVVVLGMRPVDPGAYGRLILDEAGGLQRIVEAADASAAERAVEICNAGLMVLDGSVALELLRAIRPDNAKAELYLTDAVAVARERGMDCRVVEAPEDEVLGINSRRELAVAEAILQRRLRDNAMDAGVTMTDPSTVYLAADTRFGIDVTIGPGAVFGPGVTVEDDVVINAYCHLENCTVRTGATVGPFARLRPGADVGPSAHVGNFVELKNARLGAGAKANHLSYLGDADIGAGTNIGAGTITCNYDGVSKSRTSLGDGVFVGSNTAFVAPLSVGDGAVIGAGSVITADVPANGLASARAGQKVTPDGGRRYWDKRRGGKNAK